MESSSIHSRVDESAWYHLCMTELKYLQSLSHAFLLIGPVSTLVSTTYLAAMNQQYTAH